MIARPDDEYDDDPRGQHIDSREASDAQRFGDWQSKAVKGAIILFSAAIVLWFLL